MIYSRWGHPFAFVSLQRRIFGNQLSDEHDGWPGLRLHIRIAVVSGAQAVEGPGLALIPQLIGLGKSCISFCSPSESFECLTFVVPRPSELRIKFDGFFGSL